MLPIALASVIFAAFLSDELVTFWLNLIEFGETFIKPVYFGLLGGLSLSALALFRVDFKGRRSITWWFIRLIVRLIRSGGDLRGASPIWFDFNGFKLSPLRFFAWQITKALVGALLFINIMFGMALDAIMRGWDPGIGSLPRIFILPFITPPADAAFAEANVIPLIPTLTLLISPLLQALWIRLALLVAATQILKVITPFAAAYVWGLEAPRIAKFSPTIQALAAAFLAWSMLNMFFTPFIDYNTKLWVGGAGAAALSLTAFALRDWRRVRKGGVPRLSLRQVYVRLGVLLLIVVSVGSVAAINNSIADARKVEMLGPYIAQLIYVNRYLAELDEVKEVPHIFGLTSISPDQIDASIARGRELLSVVRLWDWEAAFDKLKPQIGLIPYIDFSDSDILRFGGLLYWGASMEPIVPPTVRPEDRWYAARFVYTHVPSGFLMLDGHEGLIVDPAKFFKQRRIYYGEGGLFKDPWAAFPVGRAESAEVGGYFYDGRGGVDVPPPLAGSSSSTSSSPIQQLQCGFSGIGTCTPECKCSSHTSLIELGELP